MSSPTYNKILIPPAKQEVAWGPELVAAGTTAAAFHIEPCKPQLALMSNMYTAEEYFGKGVKTTDWIEMTHWAELTLTGDVLADGFGAQAPCYILGDHDNTGTTNTFSVGPPTVNSFATVGANHVRCVTQSFAYATGSSDVLHLVYGTIDSIKLSWAANNPLKYEIKVICFFPGAGGTGDGSTSGGVDTTFPSATMPTTLKRFGPAHNSFTFYCSDGTNPYTSTPLSGSVMLARNAKPIFSGSAGTAQPVDIMPDELVMSIDSLDTFYDGIAGSAPTKAYADYINKATWGGSAGTPSKLLFGDGTNSLEIDFWTAKWEDLKISEQDNAERLQGTVKTWQDLSTAQASGKCSAPCKVVLTSDVAQIVI